VDNPEKPDIPESFTRPQVTNYPEFAKLVNTNHQQYDSGEDQVPPVNL
jgi:hypothetical protein